MKYAKKIVFVILSTFILLNIAFSACEMVTVRGTAIDDWQDIGARSYLAIRISGCYDSEYGSFCDQMPEIGDNITLNVPSDSFSSSNYYVTGQNVEACGFPYGSDFNSFHYLHSAAVVDGESLEGYVEINGTKVTT